MAVIDWITENVSLPHLLSTGVLLLATVLTRMILVRRIRRNEAISAELRRRWIVQVRTVTFLIIVLGLMIIWGSQLRAFALSIVAIAAAIVIATKELIMCVSGALLKTSGRTFQVGDRIEINQLRGDVVDQTLLTTTILEIGPGQSTHQHTGRAVIIPNSMFLTAAVVNETFTDEYVLHVFTVPMKLTDDWKDAERRLLAAANGECAPFLEDARRHMEYLGRAEGLRVLSVEPRVTIQLPEPERVNLVVRLPAPARRKGRVEQAVLRRFAEEFRPASAAAPAEASKDAAPAPEEAAVGG